MKLFIRLGILTVVGLGSLGLLFAQIGQLHGNAGAFADTYELTARFSDATGLSPNDEIRLAGVRIGKVDGVTVDRGEAVVAMRIDDRFDVPAGSTFRLRWRNLLGQRFMEIVPPPGAVSGGPAIDPGAEVGTDATAAAADLSMLLNNTEPLLSRLDTCSLNRVMGTLAQAFAGREAVVGGAIDDAASLVSALDGRAAVIDRSLDNLERLVTGIAGRDAEIERFLDAFSTTATVLASQSEGLGLTVAQTSSLTAVLDEVLEASEADFDRILDSAVVVLDQLVADQDALREGIRTLPWATAAISRVTEEGRWFQVYARGVGIVNTFVHEPILGPDYNDTGVDDSTAPNPLFGTPYVPLPPIPTTDLGPLTVNPLTPEQGGNGVAPPAQTGTGAGGLADLLTVLLGGGS
jgi:phospholipid/cholesterol/gamma-HCH transport system substrate-binding protein